MRRPPPWESAPPPFVALPSYHPHQVRAIFERYDRDGNHRLDYSELRVALAAFGLDVTDDKSKSYLNKYDRDQSGSMEIDEFALLVEELKRTGYVT